LAKDKETKRLLSRRDTLGLIGGAGLAAIVGCGGDDDKQATQSATGTTTASATRAAAAATSRAPTSPTAPPVACVVTPALTEGPYFVDERLIRADIRSDPSSGSVKEGVPLRLNLTVSNVNGATCTPVVGAVVDMWHCDALGEYSDISGGAGQSDTSGQKFLRGYQVTDGNGQVQFQTIYPGWYRGRTIHIHFKVRTDPDSASGYEFTSQMFFDEAITDSVLARAPYSQKGSPDTRNARDNIFNPDLVVPLSAEGDGYSGTSHIGVNTA
jgi:protocatechuate 3,4-dioxygenase beta subunit